MVVSNKMLNFAPHLETNNMEQGKKYLVELVTKDYPYFALAYVKNTSITDNVLHFAKREEALIVRDKETLGKVLELISKHNSDSEKVRVMDWITEVGTTKRIFKSELL